MELKTKKTILIFVDWFIPGYKAGGPIKSVYSLVNYLKDEFDFLIITSDTDFGDDSSYSSIESNVWIKIDPSIAVFYASKSFLNKKNLTAFIQTLKYDCVYLNSFFSFYFSIVPLQLLKKGIIDVPMLIAPRGMLGKGALKLKSTKKNIFIAASKLLGLHKKIQWHATSLQERGEIESVFGERAKIDVVSNLQWSSSSQDFTPTDKKENEVMLFFLSRISEKKNLIFALEVLKRNRSGGKITFKIFGPIEDKAYWNKCLKLIEELAVLGVNVIHYGAIRNEEVAQSIADSHFLFLPTLNENFGHAIVESLSNGKPVIISDQTPWRNLENSNVGWDIPLNNIAKFEEVIQCCVQMKQPEYVAMQNEAVEYSLKICNSLDSVDATRNMFRKLLLNE